MKLFRRIFLHFEVILVWRCNKMGLFGSKTPSKIVTDTEFSWKTNKIKITDDGYLVSEGLIHFVRIPIRHIETVTYCIKGVKDAVTPEIQIIGKGVVLGTLQVEADLRDEIQDWLLEKLGL
jgi:hypothetical protein